MSSPRPFRTLTWRELAAEQDRVLAREQALAFGLGESAWNWQLVTGRWRAVLPGVAITHSGEPTERQRAWAGLLHAGRGAALTGDIGLVLRGFKGLTDPGVDVAVPWPRNVVNQRMLGGRELKVHGVRGLDRWVQPLPEPTTLSVAACVLHAVAWCPTDKAAEWRVAAAVQQRLTTPALIRDCLRQMQRLPRRALLREVLDDVELGAHAGSELEFLRFCDRFDLPRPDDLQVLVRADGKKYLDARYRRQRVGVELDGAHHRLVAHWEADALRSLQLAVARHGTGETLIRLTKGNLRHDGDQVARLLRQLLL